MKAESFACKRERQQGRGWGCRVQDGCGNEARFGGKGSDDGPTDADHGGQGLATTTIVVADKATVAYGNQSCLALVGVSTHKVPSRPFIVGP